MNDIPCTLNYRIHVTLRYLSVLKPYLQINTRISPLRQSYVYQHEAAVAAN